jgi:hypothetical protein
MKEDIINEKPLIKTVKQPLIIQVENTKNKKLTDEEQKIKHENKKNTQGNIIKKIEMK